MKHESTLQSQKGGFCDDITSTESFRLLKDDPKARLIVYCELDLDPLYSVHLLT